MQPEQPYYQPPSQAPTPPTTPGNGQYDFFMANNTPPPQNPFTAGGKPNKKVILTAAGGLAGLVILLWIIFSLAFGGKGINAAPLASLAQTQNEIARVVTVANQGDNLRQQSSKDLAQTVRLTLMTDQQDITTYLAKHGKKLGPKTLALKQSARSDDALSSAQASGTYDSTFNTLIHDQLKAYVAALNQTYRTATGQNERQMLKSQFDHAQLLLQKSEANMQS